MIALLRPHTKRINRTIMSDCDKILEAIDKYYATATKEELKEHFDRANSLVSDGITFEEYIENLNTSTSIQL